MYAFRFKDNVIIEIEKVVTTYWCFFEETEYLCYRTMVVNGIPQERESIRIKMREYEVLVMLHRMKNFKDAERYLNKWILPRFYSLDELEDDIDLEDDEAIEEEITIE
jgi:hypothetical protein